MEKASIAAKVKRLSYRLQIQKLFVEGNSIIHDNYVLFVVNIVQRYKNLRGESRIQRLIGLNQTRRKGGFITYTWPHACLPLGSC